MNSALLNVMTSAALKAGKGLLRDFGEVDQLQVSKKGPANFVTESDKRTEKLLQRELLKARPDFGFLLEEGGEIAGKDATHRWIIDPLDGTTNFIHAIPYFCTSIGLEKRENGKSEIIAGVIYDPIHNELFSAEKGKGAFLNGRRLAVTGRKTLEDALIISGTTYFTSLAHTGTTLREFGAAALDLANVAAGRADACWLSTIQPWDIAAGLLLVREAGGMVSEPTGTPATAYSASLLASNSLIHPTVAKLVSKIL